MFPLSYLASCSSALGEGIRRRKAACDTTDMPHISAPCRDACKDALAHNGAFALACRLASLHASDAQVMAQVGASSTFNHSKATNLHNSISDLQFACAVRFELLRKDMSGAQSGLGHNRFWCYPSACCGSSDVIQVLPLYLFDM